MRRQQLLGGTAKYTHYRVGMMILLPTRNQINEHVSDGVRDLLVKIMCRS